jgi:hypothetical protein
MLIARRRRFEISETEANRRGTYSGFHQDKETRMGTLFVIRMRACSMVMTLAALAAAIICAPASAAGFGGALQPGSTVCTDWLRSDGGGVYLRGYAAGSGTYTWTMRMSKTPGGPETEIFRAVARELTRNVVPPTAGTFFYRNCLNVGSQQATGYRLTLSPGIRSVNPVGGIGPHTATLAPGSVACGEFAMGPARLTGSSDRTVYWSLRGTDLDYAFLGDIFAVTGAAVDQRFDLGPWLFSMDACATNTAPVTATVSFELLEL